MKKCVYCGGPNQTKDHVPPKNFFPKPLPINLITVPCCTECNHKFSLIEDYARTVLSSGRDDDESGEVAREIWQQKVERSLLKKLSLAKEIYESFRPYKDRLAFTIDRDKIDQFIAKVVKGLFYYHNKVPLDLSYRVEVQFFPGSDNIPEHFPIDFIELINGTPLDTIDNGVIRYKRIKSVENIHFSCWILSFYNSDFNTFMAWTLKDEIPLVSEFDEGI